MTEIYLIEKGWIDPMENRNASGYTPHGFKLTEDDAKSFCESQGFWTSDDCWEIGIFNKNEKMYKYKYQKLSLI